MIPGEYRFNSEPVRINQNRKTLSLLVQNTGDRPIQVGSHFHFFEVNKALRFDRRKAYGMRLNIPSGLAVRFEPGEERPITLVEFGGEKKIHGLNGLTNGPIESPPSFKAIEEKLTKWMGNSDE